MILKPNSPRLIRLTSNVTSATTSDIRVSEQKKAGSPVAKDSRHTPALSVLPVSMLLRSLIINTVSSRPLLLNPTLSVLTFLCKPKRTWLFDVDRNPILHAILKATFYRQFCAGETSSETKAVVQGLKDLGLRGVILTYAKETVFDVRDKTSPTKRVGHLAAETETKFCPSIDAWREGTLKTIDLVSEGDYLALKLTGAGPVVTDAFTRGDLPPQQMLDALRDICTKCQANGIRIIVDAESQNFQRGIARLTLDLMRTYNRDGSALIYNTYQAYLKSMPTTLKSHLEAASRDGFTLGLKLVRGAYLATDERSLFHETKEDTDRAYDTIAQGALRQELWEYGTSVKSPLPSVNLFLASHNRHSLVTARRLHQQRLNEQLPTVPVGFGQLHGMADEVSFSLVQLKDSSGSSPGVYKCSTWGSMSECLAYMTRRAIENRDAAGRTQDEYDALKLEVRRRISSIFSSS
ncbi:FAD-linked oxidoreductase-like protein [Aspergillus ambiguus]|uniref:proline dehydrogenase family protein n=1 Tax=Aspergillus ambiguus TaxID=176160 RepID=UPI003CCD9919